MRATGTEQRIADRVAETLNLFHDMPPIRPTKKELSMMKEGKEYNESTDKERDISMLTNIPSELVYLSSLEKALAVTDPCEARTAFMEQLLRASRSKKGWWSEQTIEAMKAVRPISEGEVTKGRIRRFSDWMGGK